MNDCESCIHYPPSAADGKPCCFCETTDGQKKRTKSQSSQFFFSPNSFQPTGRFSALTRL